MSDLYWSGFLLSVIMVVGNIYVIASVSVIGGSLFGFDISSMSAILDTTSYKCYFGPPPNEDGTCSGPDSLRQGGITAAMPAGSWLGALISGYVSDIMGRKYSIMVGCIFWSVICFVQWIFCAPG